MTEIALATTKDIGIIVLGHSGTLYTNNVGGENGLLLGQEGTYYPIGPFDPTLPDPFHYVVSAPYNPYRVESFLTIFSLQKFLMALPLDSGWCNYQSWIHACVRYKKDLTAMAPYHLLLLLQDVAGQECVITYPNG